LISSNIRISNNFSVKIFEKSSSFIKPNEHLSNKRDFLKNFRRTSSFLLIVFTWIYLIQSFLNKTGDVLLNNLLVGAALALVLVFISIKLKFLTYSGGLAAFILAVPIFGFGGIKWSAPVLAFFILSSMLTKYSESRNPQTKSLFSKTGKRDHIQVFANGGVAAVLVVINQIFSGESELIYALFVSSLAAVCADTWATETGILFKNKTVSILNFKNVAPGTSGGISIAGTIGAITGAFIIALSSLFWIGQNIFNYIILITAAGLFGSLVDSFIGAALQRKNICRVCRKITEKSEHCGEKVNHYSGVKWVSNDFVNFCCSAAGALFTLLIKLA